MLSFIFRKIFTKNIKIFKINFNLKNKFTFKKKQFKK